MGVSAKLTNNLFLRILMAVIDELFKYNFQKMIPSNRSLSERGLSNFEGQCLIITSYVCSILAMHCTRLKSKKCTHMRSQLTKLFRVNAKVLTNAIPTLRDSGESQEYVLSVPFELKISI